MGTGGKPTQSTKTATARLQFTASTASTDPKATKIAKTAGLQFTASTAPTDRLQFTASTAPTDPPTLLLLHPTKRPAEVETAEVGNATKIAKTAGLQFTASTAPTDPPTLPNAKKRPAEVETLDGGNAAKNAKTARNQSATALREQKATIVLAKHKAAALKIKRFATTIVSCKSTMMLAKAFCDKGPTLDNARVVL